MAVLRRQGVAGHLWQEKGAPAKMPILSFHLDTLRVPKLVPHPALQPGAEVVDPSKVKRRFPRARRAGIRPSGAGFRWVSGPRPKAEVLESENANVPLRAAEGPREVFHPFSSKK